jgi:hypothetical protein
MKICLDKSVQYTLCKFYFLHSNKSYLKSPQSISNRFFAKPWILIEIKLSGTKLLNSLKHFHEIL